MFNIFKKKDKPQPKPRQEFTYTIVTKDGAVYKCKGMATDKGSLALHLSNSVEDHENNFFTSVDGGKFILWTKEIYLIKVD